MMKIHPGDFFFVGPKPENFVVILVLGDELNNPPPYMLYLDQPDLRLRINIEPPTEVFPRLHPFYTTTPFPPITHAYYMIDRHHAADVGARGGIDIISLPFPRAGARLRDAEGRDRRGGARPWFAGTAPLTIA